MKQPKILSILICFSLVFQPQTIIGNEESAFESFKEDYDWLVQMNNPRTHLTLSSDDPANPHNSYIYTNAIALILLVVRGTLPDLNLAKKIVESLNELQDEGGSWADAFHIQTGRITAWNRATGPNAWMVLALLHYYKKSQDPLAWKMAEKCAQWLLTHQDKNPNSYTYGGVTLGKAYPYSDVRNTEANANCLAAFYAMSVFAKKPLVRIQYREAARMVARFLTEKIWQKDHFAVAFLNSEGDLSSFPELLDSQTWTLLSLDATQKLHGISPSKYKEALKWILQYRTRANKAEGFSKVTFSYDPRLDTNSDGAVDNSIWVEGVAGAVLAFRHLGYSQQANYFYSEMEKLKLPSGRYPHIIGPPQLTWPHHMPFASVGAMWMVFAHPDINFNPFYVAD